MNAAVHQLVHGYSKGHSLLASSCELPKSALEVVIEQSDLSGHLPARVSIPSHLAAYPVPATEFYALARTWPDTDAPRSGCVITHTLLIPKDTWGTVLFPAAYLRLHKRPERDSLDLFNREIQSPNNTMGYSQSTSLTSPEAYEFLAKVFSEGLRSVVWFDCEDADSLVIAFAGLLWPSLRNTLYAHTFSLHPQAKVKNNLQLHFAPRNAQSYFSRVPKQCHMSKRPARNRNEPEQEWILELSEDLRAGRPRESYLDGLKRYGHLLGSEPSAVRNLFALRDLAGRLPHTPMAAIGILDIIDSLEPLADHAVMEKQRALDAALTVALKADAASTLHCLSLVDARLRRPSFSIAGNEAKATLKDSARQVVSKEPQTLIATFGQSKPLEESSFWEGVIDGIRVAAEGRPHSIDTLGECPSLASFIVRAAPSVARVYLRSSPNGRAKSISAVVQWIHHVERDEQRKDLRKELLSEAHDDASVPLLEELLRDVRNVDVGYTLGALFESTQGFAGASLRRVVSDFICQRFAEEAIQWGRHSRVLQANFVPELIAEAFTLSLDGLNRILKVDWMTPDDRCEVWAAFVERAAKKQLPQWFVRRAAQDSAIIEPFAECDVWSARAMRALEAIVDQCEYVPLVRSNLFSAFVQKIAATDLSDRFIPKAVDSAIAEHISGNVDRDHMLDALNLAPCEKWCEQVPAARIQNLLSSSPDRAAWRRAWDTLSTLPRPLFRRVACYQVVADFTRSFRAYWTEDVAKAWSRIVILAQEELPFENALRLSMESTAFCLNNPRLPVGQVVYAAFPAVYEAVSAGRATHVTDEMFGYFDWDKAKKLRKDVIDAYLASCWPPEELALLGARCHVLRKIVHRLQRKWRGDQYIGKMVEGLKDQGSADASSVRTELSAIVNDPDFFEPWD